MKSTAAKRVKRTPSELQGVAVAVTLLVVAVLCIFAPSFFDATGWQEPMWYVVGVAFALIGVAGMAVEISRLTGGDGRLGDFAVGIVLLLLAIIVGSVAEGWDDPPPFITGTLKALVAFLVTFGVYGSVQGIADSIKRSRTRQGAARGLPAGAWLGITGALLGLATAAVNLYGAIQTVPSSAP